MALAGYWVLSEEWLHHWFQSAPSEEGLVHFMCGHVKSITFYMPSEKLLLSQ